MSASSRASDIAGTVTPLPNGRQATSEMQASSGVFEMTGIITLISGPKRPPNKDCGPLFSERYACKTITIKPAGNPSGETVSMYLYDRWADVFKVNGMPFNPNPNPSPNLMPPSRDLLAVTWLPSAPIA